MSSKLANQQPSKGPVDLWQIGKPGGTRGQEFRASGGWREVFDYTVGTDADPINRPNAPRVITVPGVKAKPKQPSTDQLNIHFTLERDYAEGELTLFYDWYGSETDTLTLDGRLLKEIQGGRQTPAKCFAMARPLKRPTYFHHYHKGRKGRQPLDRLFEARIVVTGAYSFPEITPELTNQRQWHVNWTASTDESLLKLPSCIGDW